MPERKLQYERGVIQDRIGVHRHVHNQSEKTEGFSHCRASRQSDIGCTEYVMVKDPDGYDYFVSAQVGVDIDEAFNVVRMCQGES